MLISSGSTIQIGVDTGNWIIINKDLAKFRTSMMVVMLSAWKTNGGNVLLMLKIHGPINPLMFSNHNMDKSGSHSPTTYKTGK